MYESIFHPENAKYSEITTGWYDGRNIYGSVLAIKVNKITWIK